MTATSARAHTTQSSGRRSTAVRWAMVALAVGTAQTIPFTALGMFGDPVNVDKFNGPVDYWYTGLGIPLALVPMVLLPALHALQDGRAGRLGMAGMVVAWVGLVVYPPIFTYGEFVGESSSFGPTYLLAFLASIIGISLFVAGSWRVGLLPRWLLAAWPVAWAVGSMLAQGPTPLLLGAVYVTMAVLLHRARSV